MYLRRFLILATLTSGMWSASTLNCWGQWKMFHQPVQKPLRLLGHGWSAGYHWRNPGHDSSYYNPYSYHNSHLKSQFEYGVVNQVPSYTPSADIFAPPIDLPVPNLPVIDAQFRPATNDNTNQTNNSTQPSKARSESKPNNEPLPPPKLKAPAAEEQKKQSAPQPNRKSEPEKEWPFPID